MRIFQDIFRKKQTEKQTYATLMFGDQPLFQFQGDEYYCPTCEKMLKSGYCFEQAQEFRIDLLNQEKEQVPFMDALDAVKPLLGLLPSNYYIVFDTSLYPTDGNGHLFWNTPNKEILLPGTCIYYFGDGEWGNQRPYFTIATESSRRCSEERVDYYRKHSGARAIAYYMDGYMTALLDGHHKTMAAALEREKVNALVIARCWISRQHQEDGTFEKVLTFDTLRFGNTEQAVPIDFPIKEIPFHVGERVSEAAMQAILTKIPQPPLENRLPYDADKLAVHYPTVEDIAYIDIVGEIKEELLNEICSGKCAYTEDDTLNLLRALSGLKHPRFPEIADAFLHQNYSGQVIYEILKLILKLPRTEELENYLIEQMVEYEDEHSYIKDLILEYL